MRARMWGEFATTSQDLFDLKKDPGGIVDIEFMVQYSVLINAHKHPCLTEYTDNIRILDGLENCGLLASQDAQLMRDIYRTYRDKVHALSLQGESSIVSKIMDAV